MRKEFSKKIYMRCVTSTTRALSRFFLTDWSAETTRMLVMWMLLFSISTPVRADISVTVFLKLAKNEIHVF